MAPELRTTTAFERDLRRVNKQGKDLAGNCSPPSRPTDALEPSAGAHVEYLRETCMRSIALKLPEELLKESGRLAERLRISRAVGKMRLTPFSEIQHATEGITCFGDFGRHRAAGDKSISHRYALIASIAEGETRIRITRRGRIAILRWGA